MTEKRTRLLLVALVLGQLLLLSAQAPSAVGGQSLLAGAWLRGVGPLAALVDGAADAVSGMAMYWTTRRRLLTENERLRGENETLRQLTVPNLRVTAALERLSSAVEYGRTGDKTLRLADVVYIDHVSWLRTMILRLGGAGVATNHPVITDDGLVGRVVGVSGRYAKVQLIIDRAASAGVMIERTRRQGVVRGRGDGELALEFIPLQADLVVGDRVLTAGIDGVYPRGIPVGTVTRAAPGNELFHEVELAPAVDFAMVDHVYVLEPEALPEALSDPATPTGEPAR